jgi:hypothetical protein
MRRTPACLLLSLVVIAAIVSGCTTQPTGQPAPAPALPPSPTPTPTPVSAAPPTPTIFTLAGVLADADSGRAIPSGVVQILDGPNAGKSSSTDGNGYYSIAGVVQSSFTAHASASGYNVADRGITVSADTRLDLMLNRMPAAPPAAPPLPTPPPSTPAPSAPCAYTVSPLDVIGAPYTGVTASLTLTRTSGTCGWEATSDAVWMTLTNAAGAGGGALTYTLAPNPSFNSRVGFITVRWSGGQTPIKVIQGPHPEVSPARRE